jgi:hypothetical protein
MDAPLDEAALRALVDFEAARQRVRDRLAQLTDGPRLLRFFVHYASWNGHFANGVSALSSLLGNSRNVPRPAPRAVSDRNYVASYFFDAARRVRRSHQPRTRQPPLHGAALISMKNFFDPATRRWTKKSRRISSRSTTASWPATPVNPARRRARRRRLRHRLPPRLRVAGRPGVLADR